MCGVDEMATEIWQPLLKIKPLAENVGAKATACALEKEGAATVPSRRISGSTWMRPPSDLEQKSSGAGGRNFDAILFHMLEHQAASCSLKGVQPLRPSHDVPRAVGRQE